MPLTDSIEKPLAAERTAGQIAVFCNSYARLPEHFFARLSPTPVAKPRLIKFNETLAAELGVDIPGLNEVAAIFAGNVIPPGAFITGLTGGSGKCGASRDSFRKGSAKGP
jgi:uncharacterized protein YdiU (UPF0061 family)